MRNTDELLPDYPRTRHLPWKPNASRDDLIATEREAAVIFESMQVTVEEKVDGANVGITRGPVIRNRNHILHKGYHAKTAAKLQFAPIWNWYYDHGPCFDRLEAIAGPVSVYGEWLLALHSVAYDRLPDYLLAFDLYDPELAGFLDPLRARYYLEYAGFTTVPLLRVGRLGSYEELEHLVYQPSILSSTAQREGVYVKVSDGERVTHRFKMVRHGFIAGEHFSTRGKITKNKVTR